MSCLFRGCLAATLVALTCAPSPSQAAPVEGWLELTWGDPAAEAVDRTPRFLAELADDAGNRYRLDSKEARRSAGDLFALQGKRVAVEFAGEPATADGLATEAIVPADANLFAAPEPTIVGTTVWVTLACKFADIATEQKPVSFFASQYANTTGRLDHYWREVSYNKINLTGSNAYGWFTLPGARSTYFNTNGSANLGKLFTDCTTVANPTVNFAANGGVAGINMMFNGDLDGFAWGGGRSATLDGINRYWPSTWNPPWSFNNLAPLTHEMGHAYGLPHANNSDGDTDPYDNPWSVMSSAWANAASDATYGTIAKHIDVYDRDRLGWIDAARKMTISADGVVPAITLDRASLHGSTNTQMIVVTIAGEPSTHYYTIEARKKVGTYEPNLAGDAVIIHEVNTLRSEPAWSIDATTPPANLSNNEGSMFKVGETWTGGGFTIAVTAATANGFVVGITRGSGLPDMIFKNGYQ